MVKIRTREIYNDAGLKVSVEESVEFLHRKTDGIYQMLGKIELAEVIVRDSAGEKHRIWVAGEGLSTLKQGYTSRS